ncbi:hypothetical protein F2P81_022972 [Scophthalmus maximus]|uniref:Uncharacterized protein n=1 Tax=Scophthalmus maximus TaxID=52904 RepID=A0A6A4RXW7_SCOMX|nr:hypothetical protein F2P81_022972 [Scophthalmus maximus]
MKCDTNVRVNRPRDEKQVELRNTECRYRKNGVRLSKNSSATLLDPAAGSCSWTLQLDPAAGSCSWTLQLDPADPADPAAASTRGVFLMKREHI